MDFVTTGLGAGSYPEPPDNLHRYESEYDNYPVCECCGGDCERQLAFYDEKLLCPFCREDAIIAKSTLEDKRRFVNDNYQKQKSFYLDFLPSGIGELEVIQWIKRAFENPTRMNSKQEQENALLDYINQHKEDFVEETAV